MLIIKLTDTMSKASLRDNARYVDSKSIVMVGSASVSSDNATVNTETIKPTQRVQKNEHKIMTFLPRKMSDIRMQHTEIRSRNVPVSLNQAHSVIVLNTVLNRSFTGHNSVQSESYWYQSV